MKATLALVAALSLVACGRAEEPSEPTAEPVPTEVKDDSPALQDREVSYPCGSRSWAVNQEGGYTVSQGVKDCKARVKLQFGKPTPALSLAEKQCFGFGDRNGLYFEAYPAQDFTLKDGKLVGEPTKGHKVWEAALPEGWRKVKCSQEKWENPGS